LDFTVTVIIIRIIIVWTSWHWPSQWSFWVNEIVWAIVTCLLAETLCMKMETREIPLKINDLLEQSALKAKKIVSQI
jgi:Integral membrane protein S linking to the trans Golgi network